MDKIKPTLITGTVHFVNDETYHLGNSGPYSLQDLIDAIHFSDGAPVSDVVLRYRDEKSRMVVMDIQPSGISISIDGKQV